MVQLLLVLIRLVVVVWRAMKDPQFQALFLLVAVTLASGTLFYWHIEGWGVIDSFYFCVITLTTIGYGDLSPSTAGSKLFTVFYIMVGLGLIMGFVNAVAERSVSGEGGVRGLIRERRRRSDDLE